MLAGGDPLLSDNLFRVTNKRVLNGFLPENFIGYSTKMMGSEKDLSLHFLNLAYDNLAMFDLCSSGIVMEWGQKYFFNIH